jgi:hypothetical protein
MPTASTTRFTREMYAIVKFSNILVQKERWKLDLDAVPKIIRTKLYSCLELVSKMNERLFHVSNCNTSLAGTLKTFTPLFSAVAVEAGLQTPTTRTFCSASPG